MEAAEDQSDEEWPPCPTATGKCPGCSATIADTSACDVGHWDGNPGGPPYRLSCPNCDTTLLAFATGDESDTDIEWVAIDG
jgi:hypothetical protein